MNIRKIFGANMRHHRKAKRFTQEVLAEKAGLSVQTVGQLERGQSNAPFDTIEAVAQALDASAVALFSTNFIAAPEGARNILLHRINIALSKLNEADLNRVVSMLEAYTE